MYYYLTSMGEMCEECLNEHPPGMESNDVYCRIPWDQQASCVHCGEMQEREEIEMIGTDPWHAKAMAEAGAWGRAGNG